MTTRKKKAKNSKMMIYLAVAIVIVIAGVVGITLMNKQPEKKEDVAAVQPTQSEAVTTENATDALPETQGVTIDKNTITEEATFIPYQSGDTYMEVIAIRASDGTVRTALNTCQVCFDSGRGYYKQDGDVLVCQNCGNRFTVDQVEVAKGGCNPVPIFEQNKTETEDTITIPADFLSEQSVLFSKWKR